MKLLVCGGRDYEDRAAAFRALDAADRKRRIMLVIHGACQDRHGNLTGADRWADEWATERGVTRMPFPADWRRLGRAAGPVRNQQMLEFAAPDGVLALPGGRGTADMVARAETAGLPVWRPYG